MNGYTDSMESRIARLEQQRADDRLMIEEALTRLATLERTDSPSQPGAEQPAAPARSIDDALQRVRSLAPASDPTRERSRAGRSAQRVRSDVMRLARATTPAGTRRLAELIDHFATLEREGSPVASVGLEQFCRSNMASQRGELFVNGELPGEGTDGLFRNPGPAY